MKIRYIFLIFGVVFFATLAVVVGQRLSSEAMAVMVGVIAGVAASIPTSLIVVWVTVRHTQPSQPVQPPPPERPEPRIVVMTPNGMMSSQGMMQNASPYPQPNPYPQYPTVNAPNMGLPSQPRRFTVIGGADATIETPSEEAGGEIVWQR